MVQRKIQVGEAVDFGDGIRKWTGDLVTAQQCPAQHPHIPEISGQRTGDFVVPEVYVHQIRKRRERRRNGTGNQIVRHVENRESAEPTKVRWKVARETVTDEVKDSKERQGGYTPRNLPGNALPVRYDYAGEASELADSRRDGTGHETGTVSPFENRILGFSPEVNIGDAMVHRVAANAVPAVAAVVSGPGVEDSQVGLLKGSSESQ